MYRKNNTNTRNIRQMGQIIILTAFILSVTFLMLATLLNIIIYAENQAARGVTVAQQSSFEAQTTSKQTLRLLMKETNYEIIGLDYTKLRESYENGTAVVREIQKLRAAREFEYADANVTRIENGTRLVQDSDREFTSSGGSTAWTVVTDTNGTRNMTQTVIRSELATHSDSTETITPMLLSTFPAFETRFVTPTGAWKVYIIHKDYNSEILLYVVNPSGNEYGKCTRVTPRATINYSNRTFAGSDCTALDFLDNLTGITYSIQYYDADKVEGQYHIHTNKEYPSFATTFNNPGGSNPKRIASIYSVTYKQVYVTDRERYLTTFVIEPDAISEDNP